MQNAFQKPEVIAQIVISDHLWRQFSKEGGPFDRTRPKDDVIYAAAEKLEKAVSRLRERFPDAFPTDRGEIHNETDYDR